MHLGEIIKQYRTKHNINMRDFAELSDLSRAYISVLERNKNPNSGDPVIPSITTIHKLANAMNMDFDDLIISLDGDQLVSLDNSESKNNSKSSTLQKINDVSELLSEYRQEKVYHFAEHQLEQQRLEEHYADYVVGQTAAGEPLVGQQPVPFVGLETIRLMVNGDSMEPDFFDGDIIEYKPQPVLENGELGVFAVNGGITMKRFKTNGEVRLQSLNEKYEDLVIQEKDDFKILGKVII
ncbi:helix-turn-helix domain-containing protein [Allofustis seminis]|uniref:helix-turn-helix domain-containing protein n=1 Tax=Allofustis seminis TaxID=166939 RepID=UPI0003827C41|nr:XRE family transcriptional regulator [Allofustis seminis]